MEHRHRMVAILDDNFRTRADPGQQSGEVAGSLRFRNADYVVGHDTIIASSACENGPLPQHGSHSFAKSNERERIG